MGCLPLGAQVYDKLPHIAKDASSPNKIFPLTRLAFHRIFGQVTVSHWFLAKDDFWVASNLAFWKLRPIDFNNWGMYLIANWTVNFLSITKAIIALFQTFPINPFARGPCSIRVKSSDFCFLESLLFLPRRIIGTKALMPDAANLCTYCLTVSSHEAILFDMSAQLSPEKYRYTAEQRLKLWRSSISWDRAIPSTNVCKTFLFAVISTNVSRSLRNPVFVMLGINFSRSILFFQRKIAPDSIFQSGCL